MRTDTELQAAQAANRAKWAAHNDAILRAPRNARERALRDVLRALESYAGAHLAAYESPVGEDYILGAAWADMARAFLMFLNGDCGRFDCGDLDRRIRDLAAANGVDLE